MMLYDAMYSFVIIYTYGFRVIVTRYDGFNKRHPFLIPLIYLNIITERLIIRLNFVFCFTFNNV